MKKICFIVHGRIGKESRLIYSIEKNFAAEYDLLFVHTERSNHASELAREMINDGCDYLVSVGGDGTLNEIINGAMKARKTKREHCIIGVLPAGTGNDFVRASGFKWSIESLHEKIRSGRSTKADIGEIEYTALSGKRECRFYINIADIGIGGMVVYRVNRSRKIFGPSITFFINVIISFFKFRHMEVSIAANTFKWKGRAISVCIANGKYFGSGLGIAPFAKINDRIMDLVVIGNVRLIDFLRYLPLLRRCKPIIHPEIIYKRIMQCKIETKAKKSPVDIDGEFVGYAPLSMKMIPSAIRMIGR